MTKPTKDTPKQTKRPIINPGAKGGASSIAVYCAYKELRDITELVPHPRNPNKHGDRQIALLAKIIRHQGWRSPIVVSRRSGFVVAGHGRLQAAQLLQVENVPVDFQDFATEADEYAHLVADNRIAELAEIDQNELAGILKELDGKIDLDLTGFDINALDGVFQEKLANGELWQGMPEFEQEDKTGRVIRVHFADDGAVADFARATKLNITEKTNSVWFPERPEDLIDQLNTGKEIQSEP